MSKAFQFNLDAAASLPPNIRFGTSSWTYPGWQGLIYHREYRNEKELKASCLEEYSSFPWFRTVGIDSTFYGPPRVSTLQRYAEQVPDDFLWVSKVWEEITIPVYARHKRYGDKAGKTNPNFLNSALFIEKVLAPYSEQGLRQKTGPFVFQFQRLGSDYTKPPERFFDKLSAFLEKLPAEFQYAVEVRSPELLTVEYFGLLNNFGATHCFNHWTQMPPLREQMLLAAQAGGLSAPFYVSRILTPHGISYQQAVKRFSPYSKIVEPIPGMRKDLVTLAKRALQREVNAFIIVNNRCEGNAPQTIDAVGQMIVEGAANSPD